MSLIHMEIVNCKLEHILLTYLSTLQYLRRLLHAEWGGSKCSRQTRKVAYKFKRWKVSFNRAMNYTAKTRMSPPVHSTTACSSTVVQKRMLICRKTSQCVRYQISWFLSGNSSNVFWAFRRAIESLISQDKNNPNLNSTYGIPLTSVSRRINWRGAVAAGASGDARSTDPRARSGPSREPVHQTTPRAWLPSLSWRCGASTAHSFGSHLP